MTIQQLKKVHAKIMAMIIKSNSRSASVTFRTFGKNLDGDDEFLVDFFDMDWFEWNNNNPPNIYLWSTEKQGEEWIALVGRFLNRQKI